MVMPEPEEASTVAADHQVEDLLVYPFIESIKYRDSQCSVCIIFHNVIKILPVVWQRVQIFASLRDRLQRCQSTA